MNTASTGFSLTRTQWLICTIAAIGFAFDIYELLMLPLIIKPAMEALSKPLIEQLVAGGMGQAEATALYLPGGDGYVKWARALFFIPALVGGVFGLLGGWLTDRLGRRRILTFSILLYAVGALMAGFSQSLMFLLFCRCLVFVGVCVEFVAAVAWLAELFPNPTQREKVLGWTQAFSSIGGIMVAGMNYLAGEFSESLPEIYGAHEAWRYTLVSGFIPALPLMLIRPFLPESPEWQKKKEAGTLKRPSIKELFSPSLIKTTLVTTIVFAASYGFAFGAIQQLPQILGVKAFGTPKQSGHPEIVELVKANVGQPTGTNKETGQPAFTPQQKKQAGNTSDQIVAGVTWWQEIGGLIGRGVLALIAVMAISRRNLLRIFQIPALLVVPAVFYWLSTSFVDTSLLHIKILIGLCGILVVAQFSFWGNYIPLVFPVHLRGTGESFAANIGGRVIGTAAAFFAQTISSLEGFDLAKASALVAGIYGVIGVVVTFWLPEPSPTGEES